MAADCNPLQLRRQVLAKISNNAECSAIIWHVPGIFTVSTGVGIFPAILFKIPMTVIINRKTHPKQLVDRENELDTGMISTRSPVKT